MEAARQALAGINAERASCSSGSEDGCIRYAQQCNFAPDPRDGADELGPKLYAQLALRQVSLELREACRGANDALRKRCEAGSLAACEAALDSGWLMNAGPPVLERACDLGSARACRQLVQLLPTDSVEREATSMRADALERCRQPTSSLCRVASRAQLSIDAANRLKHQSLENCRMGTPEYCMGSAASYSQSGSGDVTLRAQLIEEACNKGSATACAHLSTLLAEGRGLPRNPERALALHDSAMTQARDTLKDCQGSDCAVFQLAYTEGGGELREQLRRAAIAPDQIAKECDAGKVAACEGLRAAYSGSASRLPEDPVRAAAFGAKANQLTEQQCQGGDPDACRTLARSLLYIAPKDVPRGRRIAAEACGRGDYSACWMLADFLDDGGSEDDPSVASAYYARAVAAAAPRCNGGDAEACERLAQAYLRGQGVAHDEKKSVEYSDRFLDLLNAK